MHQYLFHTQAAKQANIKQLGLRTDHKLANKCSAIAEMGDRLATIDMDRNLGGCVPWGRELGPHVTLCRLG